MANKRIKLEDGVTLIALIITIIVLLILAGISLSALLGDNGLLNKSTDAADLTEQAKLEEEVYFKLAEKEADYKSRSNSL